jgi:hypothetical protein
MFETYYFLNFLKNNCIYSSSNIFMNGVRPKFNSYFTFHLKLQWNLRFQFQATKLFLAPKVAWHPSKIWTWTWTWEQILLSPNPNSSSDFF